MYGSHVTITIDTYNFVHNLMASGFSEAQAKCVLDEIQKIHLHNVASKDDIAEVKTEIANVKTEISGLKMEIMVVKSEITTRFFDVMKWVIPLILGLYGLIIFKML